MYTFGRGQHGQLGHGTFLFEVDLPKPLELPCNRDIKHIACGASHTAVITSKQSFQVIMIKNIKKAPWCVSNYLNEMLISIAQESQIDCFLSAQGC